MGRPRAGTPGARSPLDSAPRPSGRPTSRASPAESRSPASTTGAQRHVPAATTPALGLGAVDRPTHGGGHRPLGISLIVAGLGGLATGAIMVGAAYASPDETIVEQRGRPTTITSSPPDGLLIGGIVIGALGIIATAIGIPVFVKSGGSEQRR